MPKHHSRSRTRQIIRSFEAKELRKRSFYSQFADNLTVFFGSLGFLVINIIVFIFWILANEGNVPGIPTFDPFPYILLITFVSLEAIVLTTIVLMSQNRENQVSTLRDELQLQVNLITEKEITKVLQLLIKILEKNNIEIDDPELEEMLKVVDASYIERKLSDQLTDSHKSMPKQMVERVEKTLVPKKVK